MNNEESRKVSAFLFTLVLAIAITFGVMFLFAHKLENQNLAVVQSLSGQVEVRKVPGWWIQMSPTIVEYPKAGIYRLNAQDGDSLDIQFNNKSKAKMNCQIGYRIDLSDDETLIRLHQQVEGKDEKIWHMILTALNTVSQGVSTKYDPSSVIGGEKFEPMVQEIYTKIMHNSELMEHGIDINYFAVDGRPIPDKDTEILFDKQKEADLAKRLAEAEKIRLEAETLKTQAQYEREIAEFKGKADAETAKLVTEAERQKKLAEIEAQKKVEVEKLAKELTLILMAKEKEAAVIAVAKEKEVAEVEAEKERAVAEIAKKTEAERLEMIKLLAELKIASAQAKKQEIELSGAITEIQQAELEYGFKKEQVKWESIGKGIAGIKLPLMMNVGTGSNGTLTNPIDNLINMMTLEKLNTVKTPTMK